MLRNYTTRELIGYAESITRSYKQLCQGFLSAAGEKGKLREQRFIKLLGELKNELLPEHICLKLCNFYLQESRSSRLVNTLGNVLGFIFGVQDSTTNCISLSTTEILANQQELLTKIEAFQAKYGAHGTGMELLPLRNSSRI